MTDKTYSSPPIATVAASALAAGVWTVRIEGLKDAPKFEALHRHRRIAKMSVEEGTGCWIVTVTLPSDVLTEGLETVHLVDRASGATVASLNIAAGRPVPTDMAEELALLRAELDLLKRAFRRHITD